MPSRRQRQGLRLVEGNATGRARYLKAGDAVAEDGIYRAYHNGHRLSHEITVLAGETFPPCVKCGLDVQFELLRAIIRPNNDPDFVVRIYQLPHPAEPEEQEKTA